eukprot:scaffold10589_cov147-Amphora_coffeaeformis.AAC.2
MFFVHRVTDTIAVPASSLALPAVQAVAAEIDERYPGRVWMDIGLIIARHQPLANTSSTASRRKMGEDKDDPEVPAITMGPGVCVAGQAASHYSATFGLIVFRPFLEEVCLGQIVASNAEGVQVSLGGFFDQIYIPAYWMLRPSSYEEATGLWVWMPEYDDDDGEEEEGEQDGHDAAPGGGGDG